MAIGTVTATRALAGFPVAAGGPAGQMMVAWGTYPVAAAVAAADLINYCRVPKGATVIGGLIYGDDLDSNASETIDFDIGWAANGDEVADPDGFGNLGVQTGDASVHMPVAGIWIPFQGVLMTAGPKTFNAETVLTLTVIAAAATFAAGRLSMNAYYTFGGM